MFQQKEINEKNFSFRKSRNSFCKEFFQESKRILSGITFLYASCIRIYDNGPGMLQSKDIECRNASKNADNEER